MSAVKSNIPPLLGDGKGQYRVWIVGNSGSGKSTVGNWLAKLLQVPFISLDELFWKPGWQETPDEEFRGKIKAAMATSEKGWIIDGEYSRVAGAVIQQYATDVIWLDPPLSLYFSRIVFRTVLRLFSRRPPCSPGCDESWQSALSAKGILWWCLSNHSVNKKRNEDRMRQWSVDSGGNMRRLGGWGSELENWKQDVVDMVRLANDG